MLFINGISYDPAINLASEEYLFRVFDEECFMIWQNDRSVIVGQYQNVREEVNMKYAEKEGIKILRRITGGGAVFHDMGNVNFSFVTSRNRGDAFDFAFFMDKIAGVLEGLGVKADVSGRNDIYIDGKKISGNAQYVSGKRVLHHGTLLFDVNIETMEQVLSTEREGITSPAVKSVKSCVTNIKKHLPGKLTVDEFVAAIGNRIRADEEIRDYSFTEEEVRNIEALAADKYLSWEWNFGSSPQYSLEKRGRWQEGSMKIFLNVSAGKITAFDVKGDFFADEHFEDRRKCVIGCTMKRDALKGVVHRLAESVYGLRGEDMLRWILYG